MRRGHVSNPLITQKTKGDFLVILSAVLSVAHTVHTDIWTPIIADSCDQP